MKQTCENNALLQHCMGWGPPHLHGNAWVEVHIMAAAVGV